MTNRRFETAMLLPLTLFLFTACGSAGVVPARELGPMTGAPDLEREYGDRDRLQDFKIVRKDTIQAELHGRPFRMPLSDDEHSVVERRNSPAAPDRIVAFWVGGLYVVYTTCYLSLHCDLELPPDSYSPAPVERERFSPPDPDR